MTSFGILIGANLGRFTNTLIGSNHDLVNLISIAIIFFAVSYVIIGMRRFSFSETIHAIEPIQKLDARDDSDIVDRICEMVGDEHNLTPREKEVLNLLARGRNGRYIQAELFISYNTAKAHIKNIYGKLDVHSHQEIINLIDEGKISSD